MTRMTGVTCRHVHGARRRPRLADGRVTSVVIALCGWLAGPCAVVVAAPPVSTGADAAGVGASPATEVPPPTDAETPDTPASAEETAPPPVVVREIEGPRSELSDGDRRRLAADARRIGRSRWLSERRALPSLRVGVGPIAPVSPARPAAAAMDLDVGLWVVPKPRARASFTLRPAVGYALVAERRDPRHAASLGVGLGVGSPIVTVSWVPALLVGAVDRAPMLALRHGIEVALGYGVVSVQARHEVIPRGARVEQSVGVMFGFDFVAIAWLAAASSQ